MSSHWLLVSIVSDEKSTVNFIEDSLYVISHPSLAALKILCLCLLTAELCYVLTWMSFHLFYLQFTELLECVDLTFFIKFRTFSSITSSYIFPLFSPLFLGFPQVSGTLFIFPYSFFFLFLRLDDLHRHSLQPTDSSLCLLKAEVAWFFF